jgi:hypothetical protein
MAKLARRKDVKVIRGHLDTFTDNLIDHGRALHELHVRLSEKRTIGTDLERIETLLNGVKAALERMGGNVLPSAMADVHALRDQMAEFRRELSGYRSMLMVLSNWLETVTVPPEKPRVTEPKPKRRYNRRQKSKPEVEISHLDTAPHNEADQELADLQSSKLEH